MVYIFYFLLNLISINFCVIPNWNFDKIAIELSDTELEYQICSKSLKDDSGTTATTYKKITKSGSSVTYKNYIQIDSGEKKDVGFECVESAYKNQLGATYLVCPKRRYHPYDYTNNNYKIPSGNTFSNGDDFEIQCYKHSVGYFIVAYLAKGAKNFYLTLDAGTSWKSIELHKGIFDYVLQNTMVDTNYEFPFAYLTVDDSRLYLKGAKLTVKSNYVGNNDVDTKELIAAKSYSKGYIQSDNTLLFITYDQTTFYSGYSDSTISDYTNIKWITVSSNLDCPFDFIDEIEIEEMNIIEDTSYAYYSLTNKNTGKKNYGLVDIKNNKIIYNTDEEITSFVPYSSNQMLALTSTSAYKICPFMNSAGNACFESCSGDFVLDIDGNKCQTECDSSKILLIPQQICSSTCDENYYYLKDNKCGLCKDFTEESKPYKLINTSGCLESFDGDSVEYYNEDLKLLKCKSGYILEDNQCIPHCFSTCKTCSEYSENENEQKCNECKDNYIFEDGNCVKSPTTIITNIPTVKITEEKILETCTNEKCLTCNVESDKDGLCLSCDENLYKKVNYTNKYSKYFNCFKEKDLEYKYYKDISTNQYKPCFQLCKKCLGPGNATHHNCLECVDNYMFRPEPNPYNNCVVFSDYYYRSAYNEYKTLDSPLCPQEAKYTIKEENNKTSCIFNCKVDKIYKYLYSGYCVKQCPNNTNETNYICKEDPQEIHISLETVFPNLNFTLENIEVLAQKYASEFYYTNNHISTYQIGDSQILIYKNPNIIRKTNLKAPNIDFCDCYEEVKKFYNITGDLIISIVDKKVKNNPSTFYSFFHPETGKKLEVGEICQNKSIKVEENLLSMLDEKNENYELQVALTKQGINIFDINDPYYKDICYDFDNPKNRDMALKDRIKETYVNVTLCDDGCINTGIDVKNNVATCDCKFNDVTNNDLIHENAALEYLVGEFFELVNSSNILVLKCYKYLFKYFTRSIGGIIIIILLGLCLIFTGIFFSFELTKMKRYIFSLTEKYISFLANYGDVFQFFPPRKNIKNKTTKNELKKFSKDINLKIDNKNNIHKNKKQSTIRTINPYSQSFKKSSNDFILDLNKQNSKFNIKKENQKVNEVSAFMQEGKKIKKYFKEYLATSPDEMEFDDAIKRDQRGFCRYFIDTLEEKQSIAYTFIASDPINTRMIKLILFSLNIALYFVVNGLFFSEAFISELYHTKEEDETFFSFIPRTIDKVIYTTIVTSFIGYMTDFFFLNENKIKGIFKREKDNRTILKRSIAMLISEIQKRYISFLIMTFVILVISLYYILCFNYVYPKTQIEWIKSSILIIIIMQILSVLKCLYETIFRSLSFKCESEKLYKVGKIFENNS